MKLVTAIEEFRAARRQVAPGATVGFIPTMGGLHEGHLALVRAARAECDVVVVSVFVNPTQFGPNEDFSKYPRTLEADTRLLQEVGVDLVYAPTPEAMYSSNHRCFVVPEGFDALPEGSFRPGHFRGVATVVTKLFNIVQPTHAFFGQKDAAQCVLIKRLVQDLNMDIHISIQPVVREADGLAQSTRNKYLSPDERKAAATVYAGLARAKEVYKSSPSTEVDSDQIRQAVMEFYEKEPLISEIQYVSIGAVSTMEEKDQVKKSEGAIVSVAVKLGSCRLIDTISLEAE